MLARREVGVGVVVGEDDRCRTAQEGRFDDASGVAVGAVDRALHAHQRSRAGNVALVVCGFEINGNECGRGHRNCAQVIGDGSLGDTRLYTDAMYSVKTRA